MSESLFLTVLASAVIHAAWNIAAKRAGGNAAVLWLAQVLAAGLSLPLALYHADAGDFTPHAAAYLIASGLTQTVYFTLLSKAYRLGDLSVVYPIARGLGVAGAAVSSALLLDEALSAQGLLGVAVICAGTGLLGIQRLTLENLKPLLFALGIGLTLTVGATTDKLAVSTIHPLVYICSMFLVASLAQAPTYLGRYRVTVKAACRTHKRTIAAVGVGSIGSYVIVLFAFRQGPLAYITAIRESSVLIGALWGYVVMKERFTFMRGLGMLCILTGLVLIRMA